MKDIELASYLRIHRKKTGLSQRDLGNIIGFLTKDQVSKHERAEVLPPLMVALSYEAVYRVPVAALFPGIYETVKQGIEERLAELERRLQQSDIKGPQAYAIARSLEWLCERSQSESSS